MSPQRIICTKKPCSIIEVWSMTCECHRLVTIMINYSSQSCLWSRTSLRVRQTEQSSGLIWAENPNFCRNEMPVSLPHMQVKGKFWWSGIEGRVGGPRRWRKANHSKKRSTLGASWLSKVSRRSWRVEDCVYVPEGHSLRLAGHLPRSLPASRHFHSPAGQCYGYHKLQIYCKQGKMRFIHAFSVSAFYLELSPSYFNFYDTMTPCCLLFIIRSYIKMSISLDNERNI